MQNPKIFIIAEIGINHNGDLDLAKKMILEAKKCGVDAVKFQKRDIDLVYSKDDLDKKRESPWGDTQRDQKFGLEFSIQDYKEIDKYCKKNDIIWFASAWDKNSLKFLQNFDLKFNKIASAMIVDKNFLSEVAKEKKHTFISTGMCDLKNIEDAVEIFKKNDCSFELMHCVSAYPFNDENADLGLISYLKEKFKCNVGYSGHEPSVSPSVIAATMGAPVIERHITLDRAMYGSDQSASLQEEGLRNLMTILRKLPNILGNGQKEILEKEIPIAKKLRYWKN